MAPFKRRRSGYQDYLTEPTSHRRRLNDGFYSISRIINPSSALHGQLRSSGDRITVDSDAGAGAGAGASAGGGGSEAKRSDEEVYYYPYIQRVCHDEQTRTVGRLRNYNGEPLPTDEEAEEIYEQLWNPDGLALGEAGNCSSDSLLSSRTAGCLGPCHFRYRASAMPARARLRACWTSFRRKMMAKLKQLFCCKNYHCSCCRSCQKKRPAQSPCQFQPRSQSESQSQSQSQSQLQSGLQSHSQSNSQPQSQSFSSHDSSKPLKYDDSVTALCCFPLHHGNSTTSSFPFPMRPHRDDTSPAPAPHPHPHDGSQSEADDSNHTLKAIIKSEINHNRRRDARRAERQACLEKTQKEPPFWSIYGREY